MRSFPRSVTLTYPQEQGPLNTQVLFQGRKANTPNVNHIKISIKFWRASLCANVPRAKNLTDAVFAQVQVHNLAWCARRLTGTSHRRWIPSDIFAYNDEVIYILVRLERKCLNYMGDVS